MEEWKRKIIEHKFYNYAELKAKQLESERDIELANMASDPENILTSGGGKKGSPTEQKALRILEQNRRWCAVIENTYNHFKFDYEHNLMQDLYIRKLNGYQIRKRREIKSRSTYHYYKDKWLAVAEMWAEEFGLFGKKQEVNTEEYLFHEVS